MPAVIEDIIEGEVRRNAAGLAATRTYLISELTGDGPGRLHGALALVPDDASEHPGIPGIFLKDTIIRPRGRNPRICKVDLVYGTDEDDEAGAGASGSGQISINGDTLTVDVDTDIHGKKLISKYVNKGVSGGLTLSTRRHTVQVDRALVTVSLRRVEKRLPRSKVFDVMGTVNKKKWSGFPKETWFMRNIGVDENDEGEFPIVYTMTYNPNRWKGLLRAKIDGLIPADAKLGDGLSEVDVYELFDFNKLGVRF